MKTQRSANQDALRSALGALTDRSDRVALANRTTKMEKPTGVQRVLNPRAKGTTALTDLAGNIEGRDTDADRQVLAWRARDPKGEAKNERQKPLPPMKRGQRRS